MPDRPWTELLALYPDGHPVRSAIKWADMDNVPVLAGVLVEEIERLTMAIGARNTESDLIWIEENDRLRALLREVADWYEHPDGEPSSSDLLDRIWDVLA